MKFANLLLVLSLIAATYSFSLKNFRLNNKKLSLLQNTTQSYNPWKLNTRYQSGDIVLENNQMYKCKNWPNSLWCALYDPKGIQSGDAWEKISETENSQFGGNKLGWKLNTVYKEGDLVKQNGQTYKCKKWPNSLWCALYDPTSSFGGDAWEKVTATTNTEDEVTLNEGNNPLNESSFNTNEENSTQINPVENHEQHLNETNVNESIKTKFENHEENSNETSVDKIENNEKYSNESNIDKNSTSNAENQNVEHSNKAGKSDEQIPIEEHSNKTEENDQNLKQINPLENHEEHFNETENHEKPSDETNVDESRTSNATENHEKQINSIENHEVHFNSTENHEEHSNETESRSSIENHTSNVENNEDYLNKTEKNASNAETNLVNSTTMLILKRYFLAKN